jgi:hypothetical protein
MSSDDSLVVKELKAQLAKAEAELKEQKDADAGATEIAELQADVKALTVQIVAQLNEEKKEAEAALKEEKEENALAMEKQEKPLNRAERVLKALQKELEELRAAESDTSKKDPDYKTFINSIDNCVTQLTNAVEGTLACHFVVFVCIHCVLLIATCHVFQILPHSPLSVFHTLLTHCRATSYMMQFIMLIPPTPSLL